VSVFGIDQLHHGQRQQNEYDPSRAQRRSRLILRLSIVTSCFNEGHLNGQYTITL
jgi:hypothetical protein